LSGADRPTSGPRDEPFRKGRHRAPATIPSRCHIRLSRWARADIRDLAVPPGNRLEKLKGRLAGFYSIRVNDQFRIVFKFQAGQASHVQNVDYH